MREPMLRFLWTAPAWLVLGAGPASAQQQPQGNDNPPAAAQPANGGLAAPEPIPPDTLGPTLQTIRVERNAPLRGLVVVDSSLSPRDDIVRRNAVVPGIEPTQLPEDRRKFWILDFAFKPVRVTTIETPRGRRQVYYLYYRVINRTGEPRMFVPQFTLVTDDGKVFDDMIIPRAVAEVEHRERPRALRAIEAREDAAIPLLGTVDIMGVLPPSGKKEGVDDAVFGVAIWEVDDAIARADSFKVYVTGLSDGSYTEEKGDAKVTRYKTLRIDYASPGDEVNRHEREIRLMDPPYTWEYKDPIRPKGQGGSASAEAAAPRRARR